MALRFISPRVPSSEAALSPVEREQLGLAWERLGLDDSDAEDRLAGSAVYAGAVEQWTVVNEQDTAVVDIWGTGIDLAAFAASSPTLVGAAIQHSYEGADDDLTASLARATRVDAPEFSVLRVIRFPLASTADQPLPRGKLSPDWSAHTIIDPLAPATRNDGTPWPRLPATGLPTKARALLHGTDLERDQATHYLCGALSAAEPRVVVATLDLLFGSLADATDAMEVVEVTRAVAPARSQEAIALYHQELVALQAESPAATALLSL